MKKLSIIFCIPVIIFTISCSQRNNFKTDTPTSGIIEIAVDECLAPIIDEQIAVFEALNPDATIIPIYTNELEAYDLFVKDSMRVIIGTRELTLNETKTIKDRKQRVWSQKLAVDGIALIVNKTNPDTLISTSTLKKIITGEITNWDQIYPDSKLGKIAIVFDSPNSSTVRYIKEEVTKNTPIGENVRATSKDTATVDIKERTPNQKVIDYVSGTPNALGLIGVNWISNPSDTTSLSFINRIKVMSVSKEEVATLDNSYKPFPYQFALGQYPLQRDVYIVISDVRGGLASGFVNFSAGEKGQRIVLKAGLLPATQVTRLVRIKRE